VIGFEQGAYMNGNPVTGLPTPSATTDAVTKAYADLIVPKYASASARDSAIPSPTNGQLAITTDYGVIWRYTGSAWTLVGIPYFADETARDTAIASPVAGMVCHTGDASTPAGNDIIRWRYRSLTSKWIWDEPRVLTMTSDMSMTSNVTYTQVAALVSPTLKANRNYRFEFDGHVVATTTAGLLVAIFGPTGCALSASAFYWDTAGVVKTANNQAVSGSINFATPAGGGDASNHSYMTGAGMCANGANTGTLSVYIRQVTSNASSSWLIRGSSFTVTEVP
jgi:hypothetical protein